MQGAQRWPVHAADLPGAQTLPLGFHRLQALCFQGLRVFIYCRERSDGLYMPLTYLSA